MADLTLDCKGMVCPLPIAKVQQKIRDMKSGMTLEVIADCDSFCDDIRDWSTKCNHPLIMINTVGGVTTAVIKV